MEGRIQGLVWLVGVMSLCDCCKGMTKVCSLGLGNRDEAWNCVTRRLQGEEEVNKGV